MDIDKGDNAEKDIVELFFGYYYNDMILGKRILSSSVS